MNFIAMDIGSTFIKAEILDLVYEKVIYTKKYHTPLKLPNKDPHYFEVDVQEIVAVVKDIIEKCVHITNDIAGVLFSTQQHGCVLQYPEAQRDIYISWQDSRCLEIAPDTGISYMQELKQKIPASVIKRAGVPIKPALALCNLYTLFKKEKLQRDIKTKVYTLGSYIIEQLTGNNICHITNAAPMGFVNLNDNKWDNEILSYAGLDFIQLPQITSELQCCGCYKYQDISIPIYPDLGDLQTSVYGTGAVSGDMIINIGTAGQLIMIQNNRPKYSDYNPSDYEIRPYYDDNWCYVISRMPGGRNFDVQINYLREVGEKIFGITLTEEEIWKRIQSSCNLANTGGIEVECNFYELPDRLADGKILHINYANFTPENVITATAVNFGKQYRYFATILCKNIGFDGTLYFSGGAVLKNPFLKEAIEREMQIKNTVDAPQDEVYKGLFKLAKRCINI
ncbi:sedoheptulokinase [uncultured Cloacibacillus sp.]|uniref:sedoheptulokinase n=1 Tax=uncultured Cloacibacillus sp. TaxID=889794 RepID=UPI0026DBF929|nr:FGGY family carbohydrate kinase [uncultured Cloacibacillus sp.]